ncbi:MFS transporter [Peristeroidobacter soli]|uniref:MFS transporter n=1 Tax=Peristeroidobacter soli TaxID=2497877 RepID=UPI00101DDA0C|nr:MFS transporter [Peristeroidobacter soli]
MNVQSTAVPLGNDTATYPSAARGWWMVAVFCLAAFVSYTDRLILSALFDPLRADLGISDAQVSLLQGAAFVVIYVLAGLPLGRLADRGRRRSLLLFGAITWCLGTAYCGMAPDFWSLFVGRLIVGIGEAALAPAGVSMLADSIPPERRGTAIGIFMMGTVVGGPAAVAIGGILLGAAETGALSSLPLIGEAAPWRIVLVVVGICGLIVPLLFLTLREPARTGTTGHDMPLSQVVSRFVRDWRLFVPLYLGMALLSVGDYGLFSWVPASLSRRFAWSSEQIGTLMGAITAVAGVTGSLAAGALSDAAARRGGTRARLGLVAAGALVAAFGASLVAVNHPGFVLAGLGLWTFASALGGIGGIAALQEIVPNELRGVSMSVLAFCNTLLGLGFGPTAVALVTERGFGEPAAVGTAISVVVAPAGLISCLLFVVLRNRSPRGSHDR